MRMLVSDIVFDIHKPLRVPNCAKDRIAWESLVNSRLWVKYINTHNESCDPDISPTDYMIVSDHARENRAEDVHLHTRIAKHLTGPISMRV